MENAVKKDKKIFVGEVVSAKMTKTVVVKSGRTFTHPKFDKIMRTDKKYKVHDEDGVAGLGDIIEFYEGRPVSKTKYMYISRVVKKA